MSEKKNQLPGLEVFGKFVRSKRIEIGCRSRADLIEKGNDLLFQDSDKEWISERYLSSIEEGKNLVSTKMLINLAFVLEMDPIDLSQVLIDCLTGSYDGENC